MPSYNNEHKGISDNVGLLLGVGEKYPVKEVIVEVGYWRKANQIHSWFVANVQEGKDDCVTYHVDRDDLAKLKDLCNEVILNPASAESLLPTKSGFFFGSQEYDDYYFQDLKDTIEIIDKALALPEGWDIKYHSSW